ncbi:MAG: hypothetical protein JJD95_00435 [Clostridium sp.]|nr:hypothetical protein [Clostridium sp.]
MESITNQIYEKVISNSATESEIIHLVNSCEKLSVETDEVIFMDDNFGFPEETINLNMQFIHCDTLDNGYHKFYEYLKSY